MWCQPSHNDGVRCEPARSRALRKERASALATRRSYGFIAVLLFCASPFLTRAQIGVGDPFPRMDDFGLEGAALPQTAGRVVLVDFWASWCAPCKASFPAFARLYADYADRGLVIVAVSVDEKPAAYSGFVRKWQPPFIVVRDAEQRLVSAVKVPTMPTSYLIDRTGKVRFVHRGFHGSASETELRRNIEAILNEKTQE